jgi:hypothetical protein
MTLRALSKTSLYSTLLSFTSWILRVSLCFFSETRCHRSRIQSQHRGTLHFGLQRCTNKSGTELEHSNASPNHSQSIFLPGNILFFDSYSRFSYAFTGKIQIGQWVSCSLRCYRRPSAVLCGPDMTVLEKVDGDAYRKAREAITRLSHTVSLVNSKFLCWVFSFALKII